MSSSTSLCASFARPSTSVDRHVHSAPALFLCRVLSCAAPPGSCDSFKDDVFLWKANMMKPHSWSGYQQIYTQRIPRPKARRVFIVLRQRHYEYLIPTHSYSYICWVSVLRIAPQGSSRACLGASSSSRQPGQQEVAEQVISSRGAPDHRLEVQLSQLLQSLHQSRIAVRESGSVLVSRGTGRGVSDSTVACSATSGDLASLNPFFRLPFFEGFPGSPLC
ncbi:hypothetical protein LX36DRAFT_312855 [Colletotrichum falcatum]|nr:hypothetical protein LX36DRAFT_312855 [Colletotrichum falcatum]